MTIDIAAYVAKILTIVGILVVVTNIITEVLKKLLWEKLPTNILATIVAMMLTIGTFLAYCSINNVLVKWYYGAGTIVLGFFVSYAAMFGFDKLKEILEKID